MVINLQTPEELKQDIYKNLQTLSQSTDPHTLLIAERLSSRLRELFMAEKMRSMETQNYNTYIPPHVCYLKFPYWKPQKGTGYYVEPLATTPGWPTFDLSLEKNLVDILVKKRAQRIAIIGRRRLGKTATIVKICEIHLKGLVPVFFITVSDNPQLFLDTVKESIAAFDPEIKPPNSIFDIMELFYWLIKSGVYVILDEFQRIKSLSRLDQKLGVFEEFKQMLIFLDAY